MRIIAFIEDHKVIDKIIAHLKLPSWLNVHLRLRSFNRSLSWWPKRAGSISEKAGPIHLLSALFRRILFLSDISILFPVLTRYFACDNFVSESQRMKIWGN